MNLSFEDWWKSQSVFDERGRWCAEVAWNAALAQQAQPKCVRCDSEATYDVLCASCQKDRHHPDHKYGDDAHAFVTAQQPETPTIQREQIEALRVTRVPKNDGDSIRIDGWNYALAAVLALFAPKETPCVHGERGPHRVPGTPPSASGSWSGSYTCPGPQSP